MRIIAIAAMAALTISLAGPVGAGGWGNRTYNQPEANAHQSQGQAQGQAQGQGQAQWAHVSTADSVVVQGDDIPEITGNVGVNIGSANNAPCGRVTFGVPSSGQGCTDRVEMATLGEWVTRYHSRDPAVRAGAAAALMHAARNDRTMRDTLRAIGIIE